MALQFDKLCAQERGAGCLKSTPAGYLRVYLLPVLPVLEQPAWTAACALQLSLLPAPLDGVAAQPITSGWTLKMSGAASVLVQA